MLSRPGRLFGLRVAAVALPLLGLTAVALQLRAEAKAEALGRARRAADMLQEHAQRVFDLQEVALTAVQARVRGMSWGEIVASPELHALLRSIDQVTPALSALGLVAPDGRMATTSAVDFPAARNDLSMRDYVQAFPDGAAPPAVPFLGEVVRSLSTGNAVFVMSRPRLRADGRGDGGVVSASVWPGYFQTYYRTVLEGPDDAIALVRRDGAVLALVPVPADPVGLRLPEAEARALAALPPGGTRVTRGPSFADGVERLHVTRRVGESDAVVEYGVALSAIRALWRERMLAPAIGASVALLLLVALVAQAERALRQRTEAEARLRAAERTSTLGLLAGGLAHDFGNITMSVVAAARLLGKRAEDPARVREIAGHLARHAERAAALSRRMLDMTRRTGRGADGAAGPVDVSDSLRDLCRLLDATLGAGVRVRGEIAPGLRAAPGLDRAGLETAVINLAANARDAMPEGGEVRVAATRVQLDQAEARPLGLTEGAWLRIAVTDTGVGMDEATLARMGEPFFTTKPEGRGTGLGLAMVAAFLRAAGGAFRARSSLGKGTTIELLLPAERRGAP